MLNSGMGIFFSPNANIMPIDFAICMKCGLITKHKTFIKLIFFKFLLHINTELFALLLVSCSYDLNELQFVMFHYQTFPYYPPNCCWRYQGLHTCSYRLFRALQECLANLLDLPFCCRWSSRSFCYSQEALVFEFLSPASNLLCCCGFLENFLTNARCTVLFEFVRAYSNTQNALSVLVNTI